MSKRWKAPHLICQPQCSGRKLQSSRCDSRWASGVCRLEWCRCEGVSLLGIGGALFGSHANSGTTTTHGAHAAAALLADGMLCSATPPTNRWPHCANNRRTRPRA